jgi:DNA-binding transcriptional regulator YhcF (GntR family)
MEALNKVIKECKDNGIQLRTLLKMVKDIYKNLCKKKYT